MGSEGRGPMDNGDMNWVFPGDYDKVLQEDLKKEAEAAVDLSSNQE